MRTPLDRVLTVGGFTWRIVLRQRLVLAGSLVAIGCCLVALLWKDVHFGGPATGFVREVGLGALVLFGTLLAIAAPAQAQMETVRDGTAAAVLAKPVHRVEFLLGQWLGSAAVVLSFCAAMGLGVVVTVAIAAGPGEPAGYGPILWATAAQGLKLVMIAALTLAVGSGSRGLLFTVMIAGVVVLMGHLRPVVEEFAALPHASGGNAAAVLVRLFPNLERFDAVADLHALPGLAGYAGTLTAVYLGAAVLVFRTREL